MISAMVPDQLDNKIIDIVNGKPGLRMADLSQTLNENYFKIRYRIYTLERYGYIKTRQERHTFKIFPVGGIE